MVSRSGARPGEIRTSDPFVCELSLTKSLIVPQTAARVVARVGAVGVAVGLAAAATVADGVGDGVSIRVPHAARSTKSSAIPRDRIAT
jgi:hypothetical protein